MKSKSRCIVENLSPQTVDDFNFVSEIAKVNITYGTDQLATTQSRMEVAWGITFEVREWGIKDVNIIVREIEASWTSDDYRNDHPVDQPGSLHWDESSMDWHVKVERRNRGSDMLYPTSAEVSIPEKSIVVVF